MSPERFNRLARVAGAWAIIIGTNPANAQFDNSGGGLGFTPPFVLNVLDYGAHCDGNHAHDDTTAFTNTINAANTLAAAGGRVMMYVPADPTHPGCELNGAIPAFDQNYIGVTGAGPVIGLVNQNTAGAGMFHWVSTNVADQNSGKILGGSLSNLRLIMNTLDTCGTVVPGVQLDRPLNFFITNIQIQNFCNNLQMNGGGSTHMVNFDVTGSSFFTSYQANAVLVDFEAYVGSGWSEWPENVDVTNVNWEDSTNDYTAYCVKIAGADGMRFGEFHIGFCGGAAGTANAGQGAQFLIQATVNGVPTQSIRLGNGQIDGNQAGDGLKIPASITTNYSLKAISLTGVEIENQATNCMDLNDPGILLDFTGTVRSCGSNGLNLQNFGNMNFRGMVTNVGWGNQSLNSSISFASPAVVSTTALAVADPILNQNVVFENQNGSTLPAAITPDQQYFVNSVPACSGAGASRVCTFNISASQGGANINTASASTGTVRTVIENYSGIAIGNITNALTLDVNEWQVYGNSWTRPASQSGAAAWINIQTDNFIGMTPSTVPGMFFDPHMDSTAMTKDPTCMAIGFGVNCLSAGSYSFGYNATAHGQYSGVFAGDNGLTNGKAEGTIGGENQTLNGDFSFSPANSNYTTDQGRMGLQVSGYNPSGHAGQVQAIDTAFRGSTSSASNLAITFDGQGQRAIAAGAGGNCLNSVANSTMSLMLELTATDVTTPANSFSYNLTSIGILNNAGTVTVNHNTAITQSTGTVPGIGGGITANNTFNCINVTFTPPTSNTDTWNVGAHLHGVEVTQ